MKFNWNEITEYINSCSDMSKIYVGCDSERYKKNDIWFVKYTTVIVVHVDGNKGCKIFGEITNERDFDKNCGKPSLRLMNEVYKGVEAYQSLLELISDRETEIHLDISTKDGEVSNCVLNQAMGYVKGTCGITPRVKPNAPMASNAADMFCKKVLNFH